MSDEPNIRKIVFPPNRIVAHVWCSVCDFEFYPTGWFDDPGGRITMDTLLEIWQDAHDDNGECRMEVSWTDITKEDDAKEADDG